MYFIWILLWRWRKSWWYFNEKITSISIDKLPSKESGELNIEIDCSLNNERIFKFIIKIEDNVVDESKLKLDLSIPNERERILKNHFDKFIP